MREFIVLVSWLAAFAVTCTSFAQTVKLNIAGAMRNVMMKGDLKSTIYLDTIHNKNHLYGIGPVDSLRGEILITDGVSYIGYVDSSSNITVKRSFDVKAPFFVYTNVEGWQQLALPDSIKTLDQLDLYLSKVLLNQHPFPFKIIGKVKLAKIHIVNFPSNKKITSPDDSHIGRVNISLNYAEVEVIGFFSTRHKGIFTHHDSNLHAHLITSDKTKMGHVDSIELIPKGAKLYLPKID